jgi:hypothetical protein
MWFLAGSQSQQISEFNTSNMGFRNSQDLRFKQQIKWKYTWTLCNEPAKTIEIGELRNKNWD